MPHRRVLLALPALAPAPIAAHAAEAWEAWEALRRAGAVALIRHSRAPGTGDPPGFRLGACETQRNLSAEGRTHAARLGAAFRGRAVPVRRVLSSRWCRAMETARLAFGEAEPFPALDSFFAGRGDRDAQTVALRDLCRAWALEEGTLVAVTHQVNITALTGLVPAEGEVVAWRGDTLAGRLRVT